jgi:hypothetical protein
VVEAEVKPSTKLLAEMVAVELVALTDQETLDLEL